MAEPIPKTYKHIKIIVAAKTEHAAVEQALDALDFVRSIWNFSINRLKTLRISSHKDYQVNKIVLGPIHTLHHPMGKLATETYWYQPEYRKPSIAFRIDPQKDRISSFYRKVRTILKSHKYADDLIIAMTRYVRALDLSDLEASFIKLWRVLEQLTDTSLDSYKVTIRRASFLFKDREYHHQVLEHLRNFRNQTIHFDSKNHNIELYIFQLKRYVEALLEFHLGSKFGFKNISDATSAMDLSKDEKYLSSKIKLFNYVKKFSQT